MLILVGCAAAAGCAALAISQWRDHGRKQADLNKTSARITELLAHDNFVEALAVQDELLAKARREGSSSASIENGNAAIDAWLTARYGRLSQAEQRKCILLLKALDGAAELGNPRLESIHFDGMRLDVTIAARTVQARAAAASGNSAHRSDPMIGNNAATGARVIDARDGAAFLFSYLGDTEAVSVQWRSDDGAGMVKVTNATADRTHLREMFNTPAK